jgi:L-ascorbate metabolism protein UlaG (beta-lactamase superfamily)
MGLKYFNRIASMSTLTITRIGHACVLLDFNGSYILTDPWFSERWGYYRGEPLGIEVKDLPHLDGVVVSHGHYDHYDVEAFKQYKDKNVPFIVKRGIGKKALDAGFTNIIELDPWETYTIGALTITATPAKHAVPEVTYMLQSPDFTVFFGADTMFIPELTEIAKRFPRIDVALLPVNGLTIRPLLNKQVVMNAEEAADLCALLKPRIAIPIHYAFTAGFLRDLLLLKYTGTAESFQKAAAKRAPDTAVHILQPGQPFKLTS